MRRGLLIRWATAASLLLFVTAVAAGPCDPPPKLNDGWLTESDARVAGFDPQRLCAALQGFAASEVNFHGLLVERRGRLVAEVYRRGRDSPINKLVGTTTQFDATTLHDLRSVSKSIVSLLWGIAQSQGKTPPLDTRVVDLLPELAGLGSDGREAITVAHLFNMSSGLAWQEPYTYNLFSNDEFGLYWRSSQVRYLFDRPMDAPAGSRFNYNGGSTAVLAQILSAAVGMPVPDYARKVLFEPLGITTWEWANDLRGRPLAFAGLRMQPRDLARIGRMVVARGQWQGRQIVPADWIDESTRGRIDTGDGLRYGYHWWVGTVEALGRNYVRVAAFGNGGQRLFLVPELDLVIVVTAGVYGKPEIGGKAGELFRSLLATIVE